MGAVYLLVVVGFVLGKFAICGLGFMIAIHIWYLYYVFNACLYFYIVTLLWVLMVLSFHFCEFWFRWETCGVVYRLVLVYRFYVLCWL